MSDLHFVRPVALWLLVLLPIVFVLAHRTRLQRGAWTKLIDPVLQPFVLTSQARDNARTLGWLWYLLVILLIVALAGPAWQRLPQPVYTQQSPLVLALDLSQSMNAQDALPSRLERAKIKVQDILLQRPDGQAALLVFAGEAFVVTPMTDDAKTIISLLPSLSARIMPVQGSHIAPALNMASELIRQSGSQNGKVILLTDGLTDQDKAEKAAAELNSRGHSVSIIAFGTEQGDVVRNDAGEFVKDQSGNIVVARVPLQALKRVANAGGGKLVASTAADTAINNLVQSGARELGGTWNENERATDVWREQGPLLVLLALPFVALLFRRGTLFAVAIAMLLPGLVFTAPVAQAGLWDDLWSRRDQQAQKKYNQERYADAAQLYSDTDWRAAALFRDGQYEDSAALLSDQSTPDAHYNRGNALAHAGNIDAAINAYEHALRLQPEHSDAKHNLEILQAMKQQQEQEQSSESEQDSEQDSDQQSQSDEQQDGEQQDGEQQDQEQGDESAQEEEQESQQQQADEQQSEAEQQAQVEQQLQESEQMTDEEKQQAVEQWLRRIPDDPGGLLRRKFMRQYRTRENKAPQGSQEW